MDGNSAREGVSELLQAIQRLCAAREMASVIDIVRTSARRLSGSDGATFVLREGDQVYYVGEDAISPLWLGRRFPATSCISGWAMLNRQSVKILDIREDPRIPQDAYRQTFVRSLAIIPVNQKEPIAAIGVYWAQPHVTTQGELELLQALADATATAVTNSELYRGLIVTRNELEDAGMRLRLALDAGAVGTWDLELSTGALIWDAKCRELFGLAEGEPIDYQGFVERVHPDDRAHVNAAVDAACARGSSGEYDIEYRTVSAQGRVSWIAARGRVQFNANGDAERFVGIVRDISQQKLADGEKTQLLSQANAANLAKDEFLAMLGHELRNPLAPIVTAVELLKRQGHTATREVDTIERQSQHLVRMVDDLLDIARVTRGKLELARRHVELRPIVVKAIEMASPLIERKRQVLHVELEPDVIVDADEFRLAQLLSNVLSNAAKYTPDAGHIHIAAHTQGADLHLSVRDTGCGISPELLPKLFAPFVQATQGSERSQGGLGLGLAIARSLAVAHSGSICAESEGIGHGSLFRVELPIVTRRSELPEQTVTLPKQSPLTRSLHMLVVDDNEDAAELMAMSLREHGHRVNVALDPVEALEAVRRETPDLAFLDIGLPVMDGYELAEQMRKELGPRCPALIAITGYGQEKDRARSAAAGFALHLVKPVQLHAVLEAVAEVVPQLPAE